MKLSEKIYLAMLIERMYPSWYGYKHKPPCDTAGVPDDLVDAYKLSDVSLKDECNIAQFEGACEVLGLRAIQDTKKWQLRVEDKKGKVLLWFDGNDSNYDLEKMAIEHYNKTGDIEI